MEWISVNSNVPIIVGEPLLVYDEIGGITIAWLCKGEDNVWRWTGALEKSYILGVTHWMPLPEPPKQI